MKPREPAGQPQIRLPAGVPGLPEPPEQPFPQVAGTLLLVHTGLVLLLQFLAASWPGLAGWLAADSLAAFVLRAVLMQGGLILIPTLLVIVLGHLPDDPLVGDRARPGSLILAVIVGVPAAVVFQGLNNLLIYLLASKGLPLPTVNPAASSFSSDWSGQRWPVMIVVFLISVLVPAVVEELMFRGVILTSLTDRGPAPSALVWQALAFALFHDDPLFILPPLLAGLMLGFLRYKSGSLLAAMMAHASLNVTTLALTPLLPRLTAQYLSISTVTTQSILYASLIAAGVAAIALVPLLILIGNLHPVRPGPVQTGWLRRRDWKFALAMVILVVTMMNIYFQSTL